jgi:hypothetical protein
MTSHKKTHGVEMKAFGQILTLPALKLETNRRQLAKNFSSRKRITPTLVLSSEKSHMRLQHFAEDKHFY